MSQGAEASFPHQRSFVIHRGEQLVMPFGWVDESNGIRPDCARAIVVLVADGVRACDYELKGSRASPHTLSFSHLDM